MNRLLMLQRWGEGRPHVSMRNVTLQAWMPELGISRANKCFSNFTYTTDCLFVHFVPMRASFLLLFAWCNCKLITFRALHIPLLALYMKSSFPSRSPALLYFPSKRSICGSHGLLVFTILTGPILLLFFPLHSHKHAHSGSLLLTLNFILCCSCICCHHGDLVYYLTPPAHKHTHTRQRRQPSPPSVFDLVL